VFADEEIVDVVVVVVLKNPQPNAGSGIAAEAATGPVAASAAI
jgi:hypothetical protein